MFNTVTCLFHDREIKREQRCEGKEGDEEEKERQKSFVLLNQL